MKPGKLLSQNSGVADKVVKYCEKTVWKNAQSLVVKYAKFAQNAVVKNCQNFCQILSQNLRKNLSDFFYVKLVTNR